MKGNILANIEIIRRSRSELSGQSFQTSSARSRTGVHNFDPRKSMPAKKIRSYRKLNGSAQNHRVESMEEAEVESFNSEYSVTERTRPPRTSVTWLQRLYELWEPQLCTSYRPGVPSPLPSGEEDEGCIVSGRDPKLSSRKKNTKKVSLDIRIGKFRAIETVVETVRHLQKIKNKASKPNFARIASVGAIDANGGGGKRNSASLRRTLSENSTI